MSTPSNPDNDTVDDDSHRGESEEQASGRTPHTTDGVDDVPPDGPA